VHSRIGIVGYRADGFFNLDIDEMDTYRKTGMLIDHYEISELAATPADPEKETAEYAARISGAKFDCGGITRRAARQSRGAVRQVQKIHGEIFSLTAARGALLAGVCEHTYGISPCAAMSVLQSEGYLLGCEGDLEGTMSMIACDAIGGQTPFLADLSQVDLNNNYALLWHCGVAPMNLWDGCCDRSLDTYFAGGRGVTTGFVLRERPHQRHAHRFGPRRRRGCSLRAAWPSSRWQNSSPAPTPRSSSTGNIADVLDTVTSTGVAHHISMIYGEHERSMRIFSEMMGYKVI
jgi:L-fucose isomerase-like protein